jgi:hypothetical protein
MDAVPRTRANEYTREPPSRNPEILYSHLYPYDNCSHVKMFYQVKRVEDIAEALFQVYSSLIRGSFRGGGEERST